MLVRGGHSGRTAGHDVAQGDEAIQGHQLPGRPGLRPGEASVPKPFLKIVFYTSQNENVADIYGDGKVKGKTCAFVAHKPLKLLQLAEDNTVDNLFPALRAAGQPELVSDIKAVTGFGLRDLQAQQEDLWKAPNTRSLDRANLTKMKQRGRLSFYNRDAPIFLELCTFFSEAGIRWVPGGEASERESRAMGAQSIIS